MPPLGSRLACGREGKNLKKTVVARSSIFERRAWSSTVKSLGLWGKNIGWLRKIDRRSPAAPLRSPSVENGRAEAKSVVRCGIFSPLAQAPKT